ncbi:MAG: arginase family protein [Bacteroidota bacterium]
MLEIIGRFQAQVDHLHVSFDLDSVDPELAPGVGTPVPGGFTYREIHTIMESLASSGLIGSFEIFNQFPKYLKISYYFT